MKINLPSIRTNQKIGSLLLLTLLNSKRVEAGQAFKNCLTYVDNDNLFYNSLLSYPWTSNDVINNGGLIDMCCNKSGQCSPVTIGTCPTKTFYCNKFAQSIFCSRSSANGLRTCQGIVGEDNITTNITLGNCLSYNASLHPIIDYFAKLPASQFTGIDQNYAVYVCPAGSPCGGLDKCAWDNGGWLCSLIINSKSIVNNCYLQWTSPFPNYNLNTPSQTITNSIIVPTDPPNEHLVEKIVIPIGTVTGTSLIAGLTYYYCKKKRTKKNDLIIANSQNQEAKKNSLKTEFVELKETELEAINENQTISRSKVPEISEAKINQLETLNSSSSNLSQKELLLVQLRNKLLGNEQLWNDYLEANKLLISNPISQFVINNLNNLQNQLLQIFSPTELDLLLENENASNQVRNPQTEYINLIEEVRGSQSTRYGNPQYYG